MTALRWYFDPISPYAYLGWPRIRALAAERELQLVPVLFAGLLGHWGQKGPAEIGPKRVWTYRDCLWRAEQAGLPFRLPAAHPFNSLPWLRLLVAEGASVAATDAVFTQLWATGADAADPQLLLATCAALGVPLDRLVDPAVKQQLQDQTAEAVRQGVFGVPSLQVDSEVFWGSEAVDFALACEADPTRLAQGDYARIEALPVGARRKVE
jgi:2-hydroxychromene-2-carboxylate isomerase